MIDLKHPSELNPFQVYQQAKRVAKRTSRAKNPDWYKEAFAIQRQWHLWFDGEESVSVLFDQQAGRWVEGPELSWMGKGGRGEDIESVAEGLSQGHELTPGEREELHGALMEALRSRELGGKVASLGVVLHVADEFVILDPAREYSSNPDFEEVQALLKEAPQEVLGDSTIDPLLNTWRVLPCWGAKENRLSMAVQMERHREVFFEAVRKYGMDNNIAVIAAGVSAPVETLRLAPLFLEWEQTKGRGDIIVMIYRNFSALAVLDGDGELLQLRSLVQREGVDYPVGLGEILLNTQASAGLAEPVVTILPMSGKAAQQKVTKELTSFFTQQAPMDIGFSELEEIGALQTIPNHRIEMLLGDESGVEALLEGKPLGENRTFVGMAAGWATQDFYPVDRVEDEKFPTWRDMQMRKWFGLAKITLFVAVIALGAWGGLKVLAAMKTEAWQASRVDPAVAAKRMVQLEKEQKELDYWEAIMQKRSPGWLVMQFVMDLFPEDSGILVTDYSYVISKELLDSRARKKKKAEALGFMREWKITGFARRDGLSYLTNLGGKDFMRGQFEAMATKYHSEGFKMEVPGRTLNVTLQREQKSYPVSGPLGKSAEGYTTSFTLVIQQRFSSEDELAIPIESGAEPGTAGK